MAIYKLSASRIAKLAANGMYGDGGNLWLQVTNNGAGKSWIFRWTERGTGRERNMGLGPLITVDLERARELAKGYRLMLLEGKDPKAERDNARLDLDIAAGRARTVSQVAHEYFEAKIARKSDNWKKLTERILRMHVHKKIGDMPIEKITRGIILDKTGLAELWVKQFPTAEKLQNHLDRIFRLAIAQGYYHHENPAAWEHLQHVLPSRDDVYRVRHHASLPHTQVGQFLKRLREYRYSPQGRGGSHIRFTPQVLSDNARISAAIRRTTPYTLAEAAAACGLHKSSMQHAIRLGKISGTKDKFGVWQVEPAEVHRVFAPWPPRPTAEPLSPLEHRPMMTLCLEVLILTGVRLGEVRQAQWKEFDLTRMVWMVPWQHLKMGRKYRMDRPVPITKSLLTVVKEAERRRTDLSDDALVFPARPDGTMFKPANFSVWLNTSSFRWGEKVTPHGFRSTLRDWCRSKGYPSEWWDIQVDHVIGNKVSQSYGPYKLLEERRGMMQAWDEYCSKPTPEPQSADVVKLSEKRKRRSA